MKITKPIMEKQLKEENNIGNIIEIKRIEDEEIKNTIFRNCEEMKLLGVKTEWKGCKFENCKCPDSRWEGSYFTDTIFENCDFSNASFTDSNFTRVTFINCKLVGCDFLNTFLYNVTIHESNCKYINLDYAIFKEVEIKNANLEYCSIKESKIKGSEFDNCILRGSQLFKTKLDKIDFSSCDIEGIIVTIEDLKGIIVNEFQAIELAKLLGITIK